MANSNSVSTYAPDEQIGRICTECESKVVWRPDDGSAPESLRIPTAAERGALERRQRQLARMAQGAMGDAERRRAAVAIAAMLDGFMRNRNLELKAKQAMIAGYVTDLQALPVWAIEGACERVRHGDVEGMSLDFAPTSARLYQLTMVEMVPLRVEEQKIAAALALQPRGGIPAEERERVAAKFQDLSTELRGRQEKPKPATDAQIGDANRRFFTRMCAADGVDPNSLASPVLLRQLGAMPAPENRQ